MAGAALVHAAAKPRALEIAVVAQNVAQRRIFIRLHCALAAIDLKPERANSHHVCAKYPVEFILTWAPPS